jgi:eukaryotic-like serine/threonine-protein kinase
MPLIAGTKLDGYEILGLLGAGGMGEVYRARDSALRREVAIKVLPSLVIRDPVRFWRFEQEAQATAALNHPNILAVYQFGTFNGTPYLVSELLEGETLRQRLARGPLQIRKAVDYGVQIARGLAAAHEKGIIHRDLKPANLFVTKDGCIKILDFGLAKLTNRQPDPADAPPTQPNETEPGAVMGTVGYMSPEQLRGVELDHRSDIFAFGAILYEMLARDSAFRRPTSADTMSAILNDDPPDISLMEQAGAPGLQRVVRRCLDKNPAQRFQSALDLAFALEALSDSNGSSASSVALAKPRANWGWLAAGAAIAAVTALVAWWRTPPSAPVVEDVIQLTDDGEPKQGKVVTDGSRVYFNEGQTGSLKIAQVSVAGGRAALVDTQLANPRIAGLVPDGSSLLVLVGGPNGPAYPLWSIPLPAGEPRRLGDAQAQDAEYFPDGRIIFTQGNVLYVADSDGSNPRKLASLDGFIRAPRVSPDGTRIALTRYSREPSTTSVLEGASDGTGFHSIFPNAEPDVSQCCAAWSSDGKRLIYITRRGFSGDLWALPLRTQLFHRWGEPVRLTNGQLSYWGGNASWGGSASSSRDGKEIYAIGTKRRGELVHYDLRSKQFVPFLAGISATDATFSRDGKWVAYLSYPDHTLWRSRADGTDRMQLTYPPMKVTFPFLSPDGKKVAFGNSRREIYVVSMDGGSPHLLGNNSDAPNWSPDGNLLVFRSWAVATHPGEKETTEVNIYDLGTGKLSVVPSSQGVIGPWWVTQDTVVAATYGGTKFLTFDLKTQKWTDLVAGAFVNWAVSTNGEYLYFTTGGPEPKALRLRFSDHQIETITSLNGLRRVVDPVFGSTQIDVAPDGSPVFTRDSGSQEIYALKVRWP